MKARLLASKPAQIVGAALAALSAVPMVGHLVTPGALAQCEPSREDDYQHYYFANWSRSAYDIPTGVRANILVKDVFVHTQFVTAWVMLDDDWTPQGRFAQIGWFEQPNNVRNTLVEYFDDTLTWRRQLLPPRNVGTSPKYRLDWYAASPVSPSFLDFIVDFSSVWQDETAITPSISHQSGEILTRASQMPGGFNSVERFTNAEVKWQSTGAYQDFAGTEVWTTNDDYFGISKVSQRELQIWDEYCPT